MVKHSLLLLLFALVATTAGAQTIRMREFVDLTLTANDLSAKIHSRMTANKVPCALIKVQLPVTGCAFEGQIVGEVEFKVNEYWVYMDVNAKRLAIKCPGVETSTVVWQEKPGPHNGVESGHTYLLTLDGYRTDPQPEQLTHNILRFSVSPANASVRINGELQALSDEGSASPYLPVGTYSYEVSAQGYETQRGSFTIGQEITTLTVVLVSTMAELTVSCETTGAQLYINEQLRGTDRWTGKLPAASYIVEARKEGHASQRQSLTLGKGETRDLRIPALEVLTGRLVVSYTPLDAELVVDGRSRGKAQQVINDIAVGRHSIEIRAEGYTAEKQTVSVNEGEERVLQGSLKEISNTVILPTPSSADVSASITNSSGTIKGHAYVDLGLSVKWATCNVGASSPEEYGDYFAWGETKTKSEHTKDNSKTYEKKKYNRDIGGDPRLDAARANWRGTWRLPTEAEFHELFDNCTWTWTTQGGHKGYKVISKKKGYEGRSIFLPAAGWRYGSSPNRAGEYGCYWSSSPDGSNDYSARVLGFGSSDHGMGWGHRRDGLSVRPVSE